MLIENAARTYLLTLAKTYADAKDLSITTVGRRFHGKDNFFTEFETGLCSVTLRKYEEMVHGFKADWPRHVKWPVGKISLSKAIGRS
jgi:hypothetical protein